MNNLSSAKEIQN